MLTYPCMLRFPDRPDALPLNLIWNFETTYTDKEPYMKTAVGLNGAAEIMRKEGVTTWNDNKILINPCFIVKK